MNPVEKKRNTQQLSIIGKQKICRACQESKKNLIKKI
jgi:hypothetical protein